MVHFADMPMVVVMVALGGSVRTSGSSNGETTGKSLQYSLVNRAPEMVPYPLIDIC